MGLYLSFDFQSAADMAVLLPIQVCVPSRSGRNLKILFATDNRFER